MEGQRLLVIDGSEDFRHAMQQLFSDRFHVTLASTGTQALALLRQQEFDLIILNLMLPEIDGLSLLEQAGPAHLPKKILAVTPHLSSYVLDCARRLDISYVLYLPCRLELLEKRVMDLAMAHIHPQDNPAEWCFVNNLLASLTLSSNLHGYPFLLDGILLASEEPPRSVTKEIYPILGQRYSCSANSVERSIRSCLELHWPDRDTELWKLYFPDQSERPSNRAFLFRMAQEVKHFRRITF